MSYLQQLTKFGINLGLGRIEELLGRLGNPHRQLRVVHIGGTNGKGSTSVMVSSILQAAGCRAGLFTSPHLHSYTERYRINGEQIRPERVTGLIRRLKPHLEAMVAEGFEHPTEFEVSTAMAFVYFLEEGVDYLVLEVGMGGAIDSTNVVLPRVAVITNVAMDHMEYLGQTIGEIASVKAGIIKPGVPLVTAAAGEALEVIEAACARQGVDPVLVGRDVTWRPLAENLSREPQKFEVAGRLGVYQDLELSLLGGHQLVNAATAVACAEVLSEQGAAISAAEIRAGLAAARWPARLELVAADPPVLIDGAHNYEGAVSLRRALDLYFPDRPVVFVLGMLGDKERAGVVDVLGPRAGAVIVTRPNSPRAGDWELLAGEAARFTPRVELMESVSGAVQRALELAGSGELVCITGSLYMVAEAREVLLPDQKSEFQF
jgi:dihydrofolate synthase/folylpolyglutamate synthase